MPLIAVVSPLFPIQAEIYRGKPIYKTILSLQRHADVKVFCPMSAYPPFLGPNYRYYPVETKFQPEGVNTEYFEYPAVPLLTRPVNGNICGAYLKKHLRDFPFDMILNYWLYPEGYASLLAAKSRQKPVIVGARGSDLRRIRDPITRTFVKRTMQGADAVLTVSEELGRCARSMGIDGGKITAIRNGCDHGVFHYVPMSDARQSLEIPAPDKLILFVGWLMPVKGTTVLLEAFNILAQEDRHVRLAFIGEGDAARVQEFVDRNGLRERVQLLGARTAPEVARWMAASNLLCLPSYSEGCPNVILEATGVGCPVVANDVGGIPETVSDENGILVSDHEPGTLAAALRSALDKPWDRKAVARRSTRGWEEVADETFAVCQDVMRQPRLDTRKARPVIRSTKRLKVTVVTPYFPISEEPYRGHSAFQTLLRMKERADINVICPIAVYPRTKWLNPSGYRYRRADLSYSPPEFSTRYFEYPVLPVVTRPINGAVCARYLEPYLSALNPDVILNYWIYPEGYAALRVGHKRGTPVVVGSIGSDILRTEDVLTHRLVTTTLRAADGVITVSEDLRRHAIQLGVAPDRVTTVLNGYNRSIFHTGDPLQARRELGLEKDIELVLYVGWLSPTKGLVELVDTVVALRDRHPRLRLAMIGEGQHQEALLKQAAATGVEDRILLLGRKSSSEVAEWLRASNVFCLPSHSEGCPNVVVEAIASGRPVVATNVGGIPELVDDTCGILIPPRDTAALTEALHLALSRSWDSEKIGARLSRGWEDAAEETYEVCCRVVSRLA